MANLSIRNLKEEARRIINKVLDKPESIATLFTKNFGLKNGIDLDPVINENRQPHERLERQKTF